MVSEMHPARQNDDGPTMQVSTPDTQLRKTTPDEVFERNSDLDDMDPKLGRQLGRRPLTAARRQSHLRLERWREIPSLPYHSTNLPTGHPTAAVLYFIRAPCIWGSPHCSMFLSFSQAF
jgi:hypothetical protein